MDLYGFLDEWCRLSFLSFSLLKASFISYFLGLSRPSLEPKAVAAPIRPAISPLPSKTTAAFPGFPSVSLNSSYPSLVSLVSVDSLPGIGCHTEDSSHEPHSVRLARVPRVG